MRNLTGALFGLLLCLAPTAQAFMSSPSTDFDAADQVFTRRAEGQAVIEQAAQMYLDLVRRGSNDQYKAYGLQQFARLKVYLGEHIMTQTSSTESQRKALYQQCRTEIAQLQNTSDADAKNVSAFWQLSCNALWMEVSSTTEQLLQLSEVRRQFDRLVDANLELRSELQLDTRYAGGGLYRALAAIYSNPLSRIVRSELPDRTKALEFVERAEAESSYPGVSISGADFFANIRRHVQILDGLNRTGEAVSLGESAIADIDSMETSQSLPLELRPETLGERRLLQNLLDDIR